MLKALNHQGYCKVIIVTCHSSKQKQSIENKGVRKPVVFGRSILLTAAGQFRIRTGFPLTFPWGTSPANEPQDGGLVFPCQTKYCIFSW
jgi:hypothetical protein